MSPEPAPRDLARLRDTEFAPVAAAAYLDAASMGPLPERSRAALEAFNRRRCAVQTLGVEEFLEPARRCREVAARLIGADPAEIALGGNTSFGLNLAALGLPLERGTTILVSAGEFPANVYPWMAQRERGVELELIPTDAAGLPDEARILERLQRGDVSVLALSSVQFGSGYRADLARLGSACRERGVFFVVDAIQSLGHLPLDVDEAAIDVLATGGHKWLCGPFGVGFAYVRSEVQARLAPRVIGWTAMQASLDIHAVTEYRWEFVDDARRYEVATLPFHDLLALAHSMELLMEVGIERIERHVLGLLDPLVEWLAEQPAARVVSSLEPGRRSGILAFRTPRLDPDVAALREAGVSCALREGAIRISPHLYNTAADLERVIEVLSAREWSR